jgi:asparagine synthetase A
LCHCSEERDDLKTLLQATLGRLESVDEVLHRADVSTAMMEEKVKALDIERLKAINKAAVARAEVDTLARSQAKMQWQSKLLERMSDIKMSTTRSKKEALAEYEKDFQQGRGQAMSAISEDDDDDDSD